MFAFASFASGTRAPRRRSPTSNRGGRGEVRGAIPRFGALVPGLTLALALLAGEAGAQATCERPTSTVARGIKCEVALDGTGDLVMSESGLDHTTTIAFAHAINAVYLGLSGRIDIDVSDSVITTTGATTRAFSAVHRGSGSGTPVVAVDIDVSNVVAASTGEGVYVHLAPQPGRESSSGEVVISVRDSSITSGGTALFVQSEAREKIDIDLTGVGIETTGPLVHGLYARQTGGGDIEIDIQGGSIKTAGRLAYGLHVQQAGAPDGEGGTKSGDILINLRDADIEAAGSAARGVQAFQSTTATGDIRIDARGGSIKHTNGGAPALYAYSRSAAGDVEVVLEDVEVVTGGVTDEGETTGFNAPGVNVYKRGTTSAPVEGDVAVVLNGGSLHAMDFYGVYARQRSSSGNISVALRGGAALSTGGTAANHGVLGYHQGSGDIAVSLDDASVSTTGRSAYGVWGYHAGAGGGVSISLNDADIRTRGGSGLGVFGYVRDDENEGSLSIRMTGGSISTAGDGAQGVLGRMRGGGDVTADFGSGRILVEGVRSVGLDLEQGVSSIGTLAAGGAIQPYGAAVGTGSIDLRLGAEARVEAPFFLGARAWLYNNANAAGRVLVNHEGEIEARDAGVLAWATRMSGHSFGEGARTADDGARTEPMIHVASSGDVTVGADVMNDFIRDRVAGEDGALSAGERAVLDAIAGNDAEGLEAALGALPEAYDDDWKAEARNLLRKRGWAPASASALAEVAADEILGIARQGVRVPAGIRVLVLDHHGYARYIRIGDLDPALNGLLTRTPEQQALFEAQATLSADERAVLEAVLLGGDLEAALARISPLYAAWKDEVRAFAKRYNAGDVRVDVSGGTITSGGDGVYVRYVLTHERNGAVMVSVAEGAVVTGGRHGIYVSGAGAGEGNFRAQSVSIDGEVTGGTGAGVYLRGGGTLIIGSTGKVGAGVLAEGGGDLSVVVAGMVTGDIRSMGDLTATVSGLVDGDIEGLGAGEHAVTVSRGGVVTGEIHLAASIVGADGTIGAARLDGGGMVAVGPTGVIRGMDGVAVRAGGAPLTVELALATRRLASVLGGAIVNEGGETTIIVNGVKLRDGAEGATGAEVPNGSRDVRLRAGAGADGVFALEEFIESHPPRAGIYEALPGLLLRLESGRARSARRTAPVSPVWVRLSGGGGSRGAERSTSGAEYDFDSFGAEAGLDVRLPWAEGLSGSVSVRHQQASADVSMPAGKGEIDLAGAGLAAALSWRGGSGWYLRGDFSVMDYAADLSSKKWGKLRRGAGAVVRSLDLEAGRRMTPDDRFSLAPRAWLARSEVSSMDSFTDSVGARFSLVKARRLTGGLGLLAEAERAAGGGTLLLRGSADLESVLSGGKTIVEVTGDRLRAEAGRTRLLLGVGARWRMGRFTMDGEISAAGLTSDDKAWGGRLDVGMRF